MNIIALWEVSGVVWWICVTVNSENRRGKLLRKSWYVSTKLHGVVSQKTVILTVQ
jgi:hypothetical protein